MSPSTIITDSVHVVGQDFQNPEAKDPVPSSMRLDMRSVFVAEISVPNTIHNTSSNLDRKPYNVKGCGKKLANMDAL